MEERERACRVDDGIRERKKSYRGRRAVAGKAIVKTDLASANNYAGPVPLTGPDVSLELELPPARFPQEAQPWKR